MLLFEHKQYLQSYDTESSIQTEISSFKILVVSEGLQRVTSWVGDITNPEVNINPAPGNMQQRGRDREEEELLTCRQN